MALLRHADLGIGTTEDVFQQRHNSRSNSCTTEVADEISPRSMASVTFSFAPWAMKGVRGSHRTEAWVLVREGFSALWRTIG